MCTLILYLEKSIRITKRNRNLMMAVHERNISLVVDLNNFPVTTYMVKSDVMIVIACHF